MIERPQTLDEAATRIYQMHSELAAIWAWMADMYARPNDPDIAAGLLDKLRENGTPIHGDAVARLQQMTTRL